ncbi:MAG TPA: cyclopropane-fatty-acyl-phospholipid synthase family protein, partial [Candidatus Lustribacter sp.]|nr:cyclopropane-fatty-acyl-phospholipid synthase family protein [Candidatus Lustribacter sp.]
RWPDIARVPRGLRSRFASRIAQTLTRQAVARLAMRMVLPGGEVCGGAARDTAPTIVVHDPEHFFARLADSGLVGFGEAYMAGDWSSPDLAAVLTVMASQMGSLVPMPLQKLRAMYVVRHPDTERNTSDNSRSNISRHYDLSNELFELFLDESLTYSSALFPGVSAEQAGAVPLGAKVEVSRPGAPSRWEDLAAAQRLKIDRMLDAARVGQGTRVLEIGSGWGELAIRAASRGATVRTITLSVEQQGKARSRIARAGFSDRVSVDLVDYRHVEGSYDAVVSCEMVEAVGHEYWPDYFRAIDARLAPGGRAVVQAITMPHDRMLATRRTYTWMHKYIFPGGFLPSTEAIVAVTRRHTSLRVVERLRMGAHYAQTLRLWHERFEAGWPQIAELTSGPLAGFDFDETFRRMWLFYLDYSRAGFSSGYLDVQQIVLERPNR